MVVEVCRYRSRGPGRRSAARAGARELAFGRGPLEQRKRTAAGGPYRGYAKRKWSWKKLYLALRLDLPPRRSDPDVTGRDAAEERVASRWM
jgi:hypothetical protein